MTTPTFATGGSTALVGGTTGLSNKHQPLCIQKIQYNVANFPGTTGQSIKLMNIPAFTMVAFLEVVIGPVALTLSNTPSVSVGDSTSNTLYVNAASTFTANLALTQAITTNPLNIYTAANYLTLTLTAGTIFPGTGLINFTIGLVDVSADAPMTTQS